MTCYRCNSELNEEARLIEGGYLYVWRFCEKCRTKQMEMKNWKKIDVPLR